MLWESDVLAASVPRATRTPWARRRAAGATPEPNRRLLGGLWTAAAPASARRRMLSSSIQIAWPRSSSGPAHRAMRGQAPPLPLRAQDGLDPRLCAGSWDPARAGAARCRTASGARCRGSRAHPDLVVGVRDGEDAVD